jgi:hypothetical protein
MQIGNKRIIFNEVITLTEGETANFDLVDPPNLPIKIEVAATRQKTTPALPPVIRWGPNSSTGKFQITFENVLDVASATLGYNDIGMVAQGRVFFAATFFKVGELITISIIFGVVPQ